MQAPTRVGRLAVGEERRREAGHVLQFGEILRRQPRLAGRDDVAVVGVPDRRREQVGERHTPALRARRLQRQHPAGDGAGHGERRERPARRHRLVLAVELATRIAARAAGSHQRTHASRGLAHEPEAVAADLAHMRVDGGDGSRHRHHRLERIAAFGDDRAPRFDGGVMRRGDDAPAMARGVEVRGCGGHAERRLTRGLSHDC